MQGDVGDARGLAASPATPRETASAATSTRPSTASATSPRVTSQAGAGVRERMRLAPYNAAAPFRVRPPGPTHARRCGLSLDREPISAAGGRCDEGGG